MRVERLGVVLEPDGDPTEAGGILNPGAARASGRRAAALSRAASPKETSRASVPFARAKRERGFDVERLGFALQPEAPYELRPHPGYGCEDPRVTYVARAECVRDGVHGVRSRRPAHRDRDLAGRVSLGTARPGAVCAAARTSSATIRTRRSSPSPSSRRTAVAALAFYHRPMLHLSSVDGRAAIPMIERMPFEDRESIRIAYVPLDPALKDRQAISATSRRACRCSRPTRTGARSRSAPARRRCASRSTAPMRGCRSSTASTSSAGAQAVAALQRRHRDSRSRASRPHSLSFAGTDHVARVATRAPRRRRQRRLSDRHRSAPDLGERIYDVYYGMGDYAVGAARVRINP